MTQQFFALPDLFQLALDCRLIQNLRDADSEIAIESALLGFRNSIANCAEEFRMMELFLKARDLSTSSVTHVFQTSIDLLRSVILKELIERSSTDLVSLSDPEIAGRFEALKRDPILQVVIRQTIADHGACRWKQMFSSLCDDEPTEGQLVIPLHINPCDQNIQKSSLMRLGTLVRVHKAQSL